MKEALGLLLAPKHYEVCLSSTKYCIEVFTDHNPLVFINCIKTKNLRLLTWSLLLQNYNLKIQHIKGQDNIITDTFSRN